MLTREAWNALLKILEEPPPRVVFVFATTEPQKIAQAAAPVLSRLQRFDLRRIGPADVKAHLQAVLADEHIDAEPEALAMIARAADGSMRDALSLTDQALSLGEGALTAERVRDALGVVPEDEYLAVLDIIAARRAGDIFPLMQRLGDSGVDFGIFLTGLADMLRAQLAVVLGSSSVDVSERARVTLEARRDRISAGDLLRMLTAIGELEQRFRKSGQQQLLLETLLIRFALLDRTVAIEDVLRGLGDGGSPVTGSRGQTSVAAPTARASSKESGVGSDAPRRSMSETGAPPPPDRPVPPPIMRDRDAGPRTEASWSPPPPSAIPSSRPATATATAPRVESRTPSIAIPATAALPTINVVTERWDDIIAAVRATRVLLAPVLEQAVPSAISASGMLTIRADDTASADGLDMGKTELLAVIKTLFPAIERITIAAPEGRATSGPPRRVTEEEIRKQRMASLRKQDPVLGAAIDALDLELLD